MLNIYLLILYKTMTSITFFVSNTQDQNATFNVVCVNGNYIYLDDIKKMLISKLNVDSQIIDSFISNVKISYLNENLDDEHITDIYHISETNYNILTIHSDKYCDYIYDKVKKIKQNPTDFKFKIISYKFKHSTNELYYIPQNEFITNTELKEFVKKHLDVDNPIFVYNGRMVSNNEIDYKKNEIYIHVKDKLDIIKVYNYFDDTEKPDESEIQNKIQQYESNSNIDELLSFYKDERVSYLMKIINEKPNLLQIVNQYISSSVEHIDISHIDIDEKLIEPLIPFVQNIFDVYKYKLDEIEVMKLLNYFEGNINKTAKYIIQHIII